MKKFLIATILFTVSTQTLAQDSTVACQSGASYVLQKQSQAVVDAANYIGQLELAKQQLTSITKERDDLKKKYESPGRSKIEETPTRKEEGKTP